jgi:hypothetical protein
MAPVDNNHNNNNNYTTRTGPLSRREMSKMGLLNNNHNNYTYNEYNFDNIPHNDTQSTTKEGAQTTEEGAQTTGEGAHTTRIGPLSTSRNVQNGSC